MPIPEQGQLVQVRRRWWVVDDVNRAAVDQRDPMHRVRLEGLDDENLGDRLDVIWEHELHTVVQSRLDLPTPQDWDPLETFEAFLLATRWTLTSVLGTLPLQAPFRGDIRIEDYQLEPVVKALAMPRVSLLVADDVGLGKTIEAGLVMQELIARQRVRRVLIVCPASLQRQWQEEMRDRFALTFQRVDRAYLQQLRREYGVHVNPWTSYPRLITSMDFLKREAPLESFRASLEHRSGALRDWDLLILDEAHNVAPSGRKTFVRDSDRTRMMREIKDAFEHRLFLTATPHNGYTESFTALLEMLDPIRFSRGPSLDRDHLHAVMVRRLKNDLVDALGNPVFHKRVVQAVEVDPGDDELRLMQLLDDYAAARLSRATDRDRLILRFGLVMLKRRLLSSVHAFHKSIQLHRTHLVDEDDEDNTLVVRTLQQRLSEEHDDDDERDQTEETAIRETARWFRVTGSEMQLVEQMQEMARQLCERPDVKARELIAWIDRELAPGSGWNDERVLIFTEFKDTLEHLRDHIEAQGWGDRLLLLYGGMPGRDDVKKAFSLPPDDGKGAVRVLLATDAAAEGLNLQRHCRHLFHVDIPWNPNRMEQRNGRIDRHGQDRTPFCRHFVFRGSQDHEFLATVVSKVETMRTDLGAVGDVIAAQVEKRLLGGRDNRLTVPSHVQRARDELGAQVVHRQRIRELQHTWRDAKERLHLDRDHLAQVVRQALRVVGQGRLEPVPGDDRAWLVRNLPASWSDARAALLDSEGRLLKAVFDETDGRDRRDTVLIHLDHPLLRRCLGVFRAHLWSLAGTGGLQRASYAVVEQLDRPVLLAFARLVCVGNRGQRLHEDLFVVGGELDAGELVPISVDRAEKLREVDGTHPAIPSELGARLRALFPLHAMKLDAAIQERATRLGKQARKDLRAKATDEARLVRDLIDQRRKEIDRTIKTLDKERASAQLDWVSEQREQADETLDWLVRRREQLDRERATAPQDVKDRYALTGNDRVRAFPLALKVLLPARML